MSEVGWQLAVSFRLGWVVAEIVLLYCCTAVQPPWWHLPACLTREAPVLSGLPVRHWDYSLYDQVLILGWPLHRLDVT